MILLLLPTSNSIFIQKKNEKEEKESVRGILKSIFEKKDTHMIDSLFSLFFTPTHVRSLTLPTLSIFCSLSEYNRRRS